MYYECDILLLVSFLMNLVQFPGDCTLWVPWNKSELMSYGLHSSIHNSNWGWGRVYLNNFIKIMFLEQHPNVDFVLEFGQFISVTWINLLRRLGFGQTHPPC